jgi:Tat protein translocase TatB subunit
MFSMSPSELLTIGIVALIVFGPRRLPELARRAGRLAAYLRSTAEEIRGEVEGDLKEVTRPFREASTDLAAAGRALRETAEGELKWVEQAVEQTTAAAKPDVEAEKATEGVAGTEATAESPNAASPPTAAEPDATEGPEAAAGPDSQ